MKQVLSEIEVLVNRVNFHHEFLEAEMQQKLDEIFNDPYSFPSKDYNYLKKVLFMITGIEKSSNFGYYFYETLQENTFPFCREVLKSAVYNEQYYNLNDKALKAYVRAYMIDTGFDSQVVMAYDEIIPEGHGYHYFDTFAQFNSLNLSHDFHLKPCFFDLIYAVFNRDQFPMTQKKAATIIGFLNLTHFTDAITGKALQILNLNKRSSDQILVMVHLVKLISIMMEKKLSEELANRIHEVITCRCNGSLPKKFSKMEEYFLSFIASVSTKTQNA